MDLLRNAGVDVSSWRKFQRGARWAAANPKYCYEWSFIQPRKVVVLNLWWANLYQHRGHILASIDPKGAAKRLDAKPVWVRRSLAMGAHVREAVERGMEIRVIINDGPMRRPNDPYSRASKVTARQLDPEPWHVRQYDLRSGKCILIRGGGQHGPKSLGGVQRSTSSSQARKREVVAVSPTPKHRRWLESFAARLVERLRPTTSAIVKYRSASALRALPDGDDMGLWIELGKLRSNPAVTPELWLDQYAEEGSFRLFFGLGAHKQAKLDDVAPHLLREFGTPRSITDDDLDESDRLARPIQGDEFTKPIFSVHDTSSFGWYQRRPYPFSRSAEGALTARAVESFERILQCLPVTEPKTSKRDDADLAASIVSEGQQFAADAGFRRILENYAVSRARTHFERLDYKVQHVGAYESFDLICQKGRERLFVEVKGTTTIGRHVLMTANEVSLANDPKTASALFVVSAVKMKRTRTGWHAHGGVNRCIWPWRPKESRLQSILFRYTV